MSTFLPAEKGTTIRQPSTANLMLDSADRSAVYPLANSFQISKPQALMNGYFTRIGTTEVVLEYNRPNLASALANNTITIDLSGTTSGTASQTFTATGFYTAEQLIRWLSERLTDMSGTVVPNATWSVAATTGAEGQGSGAILTPSALVYAEFSGPIANALGISGTGLLEYGPAPADQQLFISNVNVDLRPFRYLDFVSPQLTYNQDLKDAATNSVVRDVLCRWYMDWDEQPALDGFGFPILMGYTPFKARRLFNPPKQIRWDNIQPIGNLAFEVYTDQNVLAPFNFNTNWLMTLQVSEV
jgi:hypothetical protein